MVGSASRRDLKTAFYLCEGEGGASRPGAEAPGTPRRQLLDDFIRINEDMNALCGNPPTLETGESPCSPAASMCGTAYSSVGGEVKREDAAPAPPPAPPAPGREASGVRAQGKQWGSVYVEDHEEERRDGAAPLQPSLYRGSARSPPTPPSARSDEGPAGSDPVDPRRSFGLNTAPDDDLTFALSRPRNDGTSHSQILAEAEEEMDDRRGGGYFCPSVSLRSLGRRSPGARRTSFARRNSEPAKRRLTLEDFEALKPIGEGAFSQVLLVRKTREPDKGGVYAMKTISKLADNKSYFDRCIRAERVALGMMESPFVVTLRYAFQTTAGLYSLTDYYEGGSLESHLPEEGMDEARARFHAAELLLALRHVHDHKIVHRDLKLTNVLIDARGFVALTDFGLCAPNVRLETQPLHSFCGSVEYMAPEILKGHRYGHAVDWWAFGVLAYELVHGKTPFFGTKAREIMEAIISGPLTFHGADSEELSHTLAQLMAKKPETRAGFGTKGARDVMNLPFFFKMDWPSMEARRVPPPFAPKNAKQPRASVAAMPHASFAGLAHEFAANKESAPVERRRLKRFSFAGRPYVPPKPAA